MDEFYQPRTNDPMPGGQTTEIAAEPAPVVEKKKSWLGALKGFIVLAIAKFKTILLAMKFLGFSKIFITMGSMIVSIFVDSRVFGWPFAVGFVLLIFIHEMGHVLMIRAKGMKAGAPVFIPFVGALIALKEMPQDAKTEAEIGIAGPILGTIGASLCYVIGLSTGLDILMHLAYVGFFINIFNLLPVLPLDGGRVMAAISPKVWAVGLVLVIGMLFTSFNPFLVVLVVMSGPRTWHALKSRQEDLAYYNVPKATRIKITTAYFGLALFIGAMMMQLHNAR